MKRDPVHGRLHFHVPHKVPTYGQDRIEQRSAKTPLNDAVPAPTSCPVLALLVHEEEDLVEHHLELARILDMYQPTAARQQIPDWEIHLLIKSSPGLIHSIDGLLVGDLRLSRSEIILNMSLP